MSSRIGIYAGTFNPVHTGHIVFALQAMEHAQLDAVYFLPERRPRHKHGVEHFGHRVAMLRRATQPYRCFSVLELNDVSFTVERTLPALYTKFSDSQLVFLFGSDAVRGISNWPLYRRLVASNELVVGARAADTKKEIEAIIDTWDIQPKNVHIFESPAPQTASSAIREALRLRKEAPGTLLSVKRYSEQNWLYVSVT